MSRSLKLLTGLILAVAGSAALGQDPTKPLPRPDGKPADHTKKVKVFILLGQSNMLGFGRVGPKETKGSLEYMIKEKGKYGFLVDDAGAWTRASGSRDECRRTTPARGPRGRTSATFTSWINAASISRTWRSSAT